MLSAEAAVDPVDLSISRWNVATTSAAVSGAPLWNLTPWRSLKVQVLTSSDGVQPVARSGAGGQPMRIDVDGWCRGEPQRSTAPGLTRACAGRLRLSLRCAGRPRSAPFLFGP